MTWRSLSVRPHAAVEFAQAMSAAAVGAAAGVAGAAGVAAMGAAAGAGAAGSAGAGPDGRALYEAPAPDAGRPKPTRPASARGRYVIPAAYTPVNTYDDEPPGGGSHDFGTSMTGRGAFDLGRTWQMLLATFLAIVPAILLAALLVTWVPFTSRVEG